MENVARDAVWSSDWSMACGAARVALGERWRRSGERLSLRLPLLDLERERDLRERERDLPLLDCSRYRGCCAAINLSGGLVFGGCALADPPATFGAGALTRT